jgi:hypothetical protein
MKKRNYNNKDWVKVSQRNLLNNKMINQTNTKNN